MTGGFDDWLAEVRATTQAGLAMTARELRLRQRIDTLIDRVAELEDELAEARKRKRRCPTCEPELPHGARARYANGCRCRPCKDAHAAYIRERRRRKKEAA